jgi:small-conductance mechanosensitive channel
MGVGLETLVFAFQQQEEATTSDETIEVVCSNQGAVCDVLYEWTDSEFFAEGVSFIIGVPVKILLIIALALVLNRIAQKGIRRLTVRLGTATAAHGDSIVTERSVERAEQRASTAGSLLRSLSTAVVYGAALILIFEVFGISMIPIIASAGVLAIAIGFGAQSLVEDMLRGVFMLAEDQFGVGDRISTGPVNGYVERITLRTTVIRDTQGTLWHIPNSQIDWVANEAQETSRATIEIGVSYNADLDDAMEVLLQAASSAAADPAWQEHVTRPPEVSGVQDLADDAVNIRVIVWVDAGERRKFERPPPPPPEGSPRCSRHPGAQPTGRRLDARRGCRRVNRPCIGFSGSDERLRFALRPVGPTSPELGARRAEHITLPVVSVDGEAVTGPRVPAGEGPAAA